MKSCCALLVLAMAAAVAADTADVTHCLGAAAPVACFQTLAFRRVRELASQDTIVLSQGVELVRRPSSGQQGRKAEDVAAEALLEQPHQGDEEHRQEALQQYVADKVHEAVSERSLSLRVDEVAASVADTVRAISSGEGRAIKKIIKSLLPVIVGFVLKVATLVVISYIGIGLLAKKAAIGSLLAVIISIVTFVRSLIVSKHHKAHDQAQLLGALAGQVSAYHNVAATQDIVNTIATQQAAAALQAHQASPYHGWKH